MKKIFLPISIVLVTSFTISCSNGLLVDEEQARKKTITEAFTENSVMIRRYLSERPKELDEYSSSSRNAQTDAVERLNMINKNIEDWQKLDKMCREYITKNQNNIFAYEKVHASAAEILDIYLLRVDDKHNETLKEAIAYYTNKLVELKTYESGILAESLKKLKGYLPSDKIEEIRKFGLLQSKKFAKERKHFEFLDKEVLDMVEHDGKKALEDLIN